MSVRTKGAVDSVMPTRAGPGQALYTLMVLILNAHIPPLTSPSGGASLDNSTLHETVPRPLACDAT